MDVVIGIDVLDINVVAKIATGCPIIKHVEEFVQKEPVVADMMHHVIVFVPKADIEFRRCREACGPPLPQRPAHPAHYANASCTSSTYLSFRRQRAQTSS